MKIIYIICFFILIIIFNYQNNIQEGFTFTSLVNQNVNSSLIAIGLLFGLIIGSIINGKTGGEIGAIIGGLTIGILNYIGLFKLSQNTNINNNQEIETFSSKSRKKREDRREKNRLKKLKKQQDFTQKFNKLMSDKKKQIMNPQIDIEKIINDATLEVSQKKKSLMLFNQKLKNINNETDPIKKHKLVSKLDKIK